MRIGILGTGVVGETIATRLVELGHEVTMGARSAGSEKATEWAAGAGNGASEGSFADAANPICRTNTSFCTSRGE